MMVRIRFLYVFLLLMAVQLAVAQNGVQQYEYWLNSDYEQRKVVVGNVPETFTMDISHLSYGLHYFNFRAKANSGQWGALSRYMVYLSDNGAGSNSVTGYEYWLDNDYVNCKQAVGNSVPETLTMDISHLSPGLHYFNFRAKTVSGQWGALSRYMVYLSDNGAGSNSVTGYEYWLDNDYANRKQTAGSSAQDALTMDISHLSPGLHHFNFRAKTVSGQWGALSRYMIYLQNRNAVNAQVKKVEYWIDGNEEQKLSQDVANDSVVITMDISNLAFGTHLFNVQCQATNGEWSLPTSYEFTVSDLPPVSTPIISHAGDTITISNGKEADGNYPITYYYTLDGTEPTDSSTLYETPFEVTCNLTVKAIGFQYGHNPSEVAELKVDWFKVATPTFVQYGNTLTISCDTENATIYYTIGGGEESVYSGPIILQDESVVTAVGRLEGYHDSEIATWHPGQTSVPTPVISRDGNTVIVSDGDGVDSDYPIMYHYTTDGTQPTENSTLYEAPIQVARNMIIKVVGIQYGHNQSAVATLNVDWFKVATPVFVQQGNRLTISCDTTQATIFYTIGNGEEQVYSEPVRLADTQIVTAVGRVDGYHDSEAATYQPWTVKSATPEVAYDGRTVRLRLTSADEGAVFYYTLDGTSPVDGLDRSEQAIEYRGEFNVSSLCLLRAVAVVDTLNVSDEKAYSIDYLFDGEKAFVRQANVLEKAFEWRGGIGGVERLAVEGPLGNADVELLKAAPLLAHLDLTEATMNRLPDDAFNRSNLVSFVSPYAVGSAGGQLFANSPRLAAVVWNADIALGENVFDGVDNPNLLLYVSKADYARSSAAPNVVVDGVIENLVLTDKDTGNNDFYCPQAFTANNVSYTHNFKMQTIIGVSRGWETLTLPFTVQTITHERNGQLQPFMADGDGKPFWLLQMSSAGLEPATEIKANQPYVISMPNNQAYSDEYNQAGRVTFAASHATIEPTVLNGIEGLGVVLMPALQSVAKDDDVFAINRNDAYGAYAEGSVFVPNYREVRPFEAYTLHPASGRSLIDLSSLIGDSATGIVAIPIKEAADGTVSVYSLSGLLVATGQYDEVMKRLHKGVYIINGKKMVIK